MMPRGSRIVWLTLLAASCLAAQTPSRDSGLTLGETVTAALKYYPSIRVSEEQINAAAAQIRLARTAFLPRVDALTQFNRGTRNNIFGQLMPQLPSSVIPSMSGPVIGTNNFGAAWGSAAGSLVSWEPFDFGFRQAQVAAAASARAHSEASLERTRFDVAVTAADAWMTLAAAEQTVRAAQAGVDRAGTIVNVTKALVNAELKPGADQSRAEAELAAARTEQIQAEQAEGVARATLAAFIGAEPAQIRISWSRLLDLPPAPEAAPASRAAFNAAANPLVIEQNAAVSQAEVELHALERSYFPRFYVEGSAYARGSGAETDGRILGGLNGLGPNVQNYAVGLTVSFAAMDKPALAAREAEQVAVIRYEQERTRQIVADLTGRWNAAVATLEGARRIAANTPVQLAAARTTLNQASARYQSGLGNIEEVAEAQRLVTQSEIDNSLSNLGVWRGLLGLAASAGDLKPFLAEAGQ